MHEFYRIIDEQANQVRGLLADLLDQGRIETGTVSLAPQPAEVAGLMEQARRTFQGGGGTHVLSIDLPDDRQGAGRGHRRLHRQALLAVGADGAGAGGPA